MNDQTAKRLRDLIQEGDAIAKKLAKAVRRGDPEVEKLVARLKNVEQGIETTKRGAATRNELAALKARSGDSERDLDAYLDALEGAGRWDEFVAIASTEIERFLAKGRRLLPGERERLRQLVDRHNRALDCAKGEAHGEK